MRTAWNEMNMVRNLHQLKWYHSRSLLLHIRSISPHFPLRLIIHLLFFCFLLPTPLMGVDNATAQENRELTIALSNTTLKSDHLMYVNVTLTADNNTGDVTILVQDSEYLPVLVESTELTEGKASFEFSLFWWHPNGTYTVNSTARTSDNRTYNGTGVTFEFNNWTQDEPIPVITDPDNGDDGLVIPIPLPPAPLLILTGVTMASILLAYSTEKGRFGFWLFFLPLYTRLKKSETLEDFNRGRIYEVIKQEPGIRYSEIRKKVGIENGVLTYHLRVLEKMKLVKGVGDKTLKRFYPWGETVALPPDLEKPFTPMQSSIVDFLSKNTWSTQKEIASPLQAKQQTVSKNLKKLEQTNIVKKMSELNVYKYNLTEGYLHWLNQQVSPKCPTCMNVCRIGARFCENCGTKLTD